jgi:phosphonatase-like hydrolase
MTKLDMVIFDLAGTTVKDEGQVPAAFTSALAEYGVQVTPEQIKGVRGASKRQALLSFIKPGPEQAEMAEEVYSVFKNHLARHFAPGKVGEVPGSGQVFLTLRERGVRVALNTGFDRETTMLLLDSLGWASGIVDGVVCGDEVAQGRPAPYLIFKAMEVVGAKDVHRVANVGDTILDLQAGYNAGVGWNIGVLSGAHDRQTLESAPHTHILHSVAEVPNLFELLD